ncbi:DegV family protein [Listeria booriae]|uniref:DegV family protein n=1 Tax=Listeria booriae TaxID=1552123 RepID=UPI001628724E|nr:DegV family protein [Listeria booriae]MBC2180931.1 DegV family EDD domain-containing protein [Listeria booriae]MBC2190623.1 DegV family EDD domain-containing protein [Listeria booriae]
MTDFLDSKRLYHAFLGGARAVIHAKDGLNAINVFPVADGDTGSNLAQTMNSIVEDSKIGNTVKETLYTISEAALFGARGNSGIIFAQYINGMHFHLSDDKQMSLHDFSKSVSGGASYAYNAMENPVEGTMITVIKVWSEAISEAANKGIAFQEALMNALDYAKKTLENTPKMLPILRDKGVVDAGAKGFFTFVEGFTLALGNKAYVPKVESLPALSVQEELDEAPTFRYCTEVLVRGEGLSRDAISAHLKPFGDSLIVAGNETKVRVHIHTNEPQSVSDFLSKQGTMIQQKVDDMQNQYDIIHHRKHRIALVTDSVADLPPSLLEKYQIQMIPLPISWDDNVYLDKLTMTTETLLTNISDSKAYPSSSQPNEKAVANQLSFLANHYDEILVLTVAGKLSGTYETMKRAAAGIEANIAVIDTMQNSGAQGLIVKAAAEQIAAGKTFVEVQDFVKQSITRTKIFVSVPNLDAMIRSGRLGEKGGAIGNTLNLKPVVSLSETGAGLVSDIAFSLTGSTNKIVKRVKKMMAQGSVADYAIVHANTPERAEEYTALFTDLVGKAPAYVTGISSIIAMNAGNGCVAIAIQLEGEK